jgi:hypothetical protein
VGGLSRRRVAALAGGAVLVVAVGAALLFVGPLSGSSAKPPAAVQQALERLGADDDGELVTERVTTQATVKLWAASSEDGIRCYLLEFVEIARAEGACPSQRDAAVPLFLNRSVTHLRENVHFLHGEVAEGVDAIVLGFNDGRRQRVTTSDGFVLHEITGAEPSFILAAGEEPGAVGLVGSRGPLSVGFGRRSFFGRRTAAEFRTETRRRAALTLAVGGRATHCRQVEYPGVETIRCDRQLARGLAVARTYVGPLAGGSVFVHGLIGADVDSLRIRLDGGRQIPLEFIAGAFLYEVEPGTAVDAVIGLDRSGRVVAEAPL